MGTLFILLMTIPSLGWFLHIHEKDKALRRRDEDLRHSIGRGKFLLCLPLSFIAMYVPVVIAARLIYPPSFDLATAVALTPPLVVNAVFGVASIGPFVMRLRDIGWPSWLGAIPLIGLLSWLFASACDINTVDGRGAFQAFSFIAALWPFMWVVLAIVPPASRDYELA